MIFFLLVGLSTYAILSGIILQFCFKVKGEIGITELPHRKQKSLFVVLNAGTAVYRCGIKKLFQRT